MDEHCQSIVDYHRKKRALEHEHIAGGARAEQLNKTIESLSERLKYARYEQIRIILSDQLKSAQAEYDALSLKDDVLWQKMKKLEQEPPEPRPGFDPEPRLLGDSTHEHSSDCQTEACGCTVFYYGIDVQTSQKEFCKTHK